MRPVYCRWIESLLLALLSALALFLGRLVCQSLPLRLLGLSYSAQTSASETHIILTQSARRQDRAMSVLPLFYALQRRGDKGAAWAGEQARSAALCHVTVKPGLTASRPHCRLAASGARWACERPSALASASPARTRQMLTDTFGRQWTKLRVPSIGSMIQAKPGWHSCSSILSL